MKPVTVAAFNSREEAEPLRAWLCAQGIEAEIRRETDPDGLLHFARPAPGVRVEVRREDFEAALNLVYGWNNSADEGFPPSELPRVADERGPRPSPHPPQRGT